MECAASAASGLRLVSVVVLSLPARQQFLEVVFQQVARQTWLTARHGQLEVLVAEVNRVRAPAEESDGGHSLRQSHSDLALISASFCRNNSVAPG